MRGFFGSRRKAGLRLIGLLAAATLVAAACNGDEPVADEEVPEEAPVRVAVFLAAAANSYSQAQLEGAQDAAAEMNAEVEFFDGEFDTDTQFSQMQDATASGRFDAFVVSANDGNAMQPAIEEATDAGILVACVLAPCGPQLDSLEPQAEGQLAHVGKSFPENGRQIASLVVDACGDRDPCNVAYIPGLLEAAPYELARLEGLEEVLDEHDNIDVVATQEGGYLAEPALQVTQDLLQARRDIHVIASSGDQMIVGSEQAVQEAGLEGEILLVGNGASELGVEAMAEGRWFGSPVYMPYTEGLEATELLIRAARGETGLPTSIDTDELAEVGVLITPDNVDQWEAEWIG